MTAPLSLRTRLQRQQAALIELARAWRAHERDVGRAIPAITETAVAALEVARASVWLLDEARQQLVCRDLCRAGDLAHERGAVLSVTQYPAYFAAIEAAEVVAAEDAHTDPRTAEFGASYLAPLGIGALLDAPIRVAGRVVGVLCHEHVGSTREWSLDDSSAASYLASLVSLALEIERRQRSEVHLARSLALLRTTLEAISEGILAVDRDGRVVAHNGRLLEMWGLDEHLLGPAGDGGPRLTFLAQQTTDPDGYIASARRLFALPEAESVDVIELCDGRVFERTSRPQRLGDEVIGRVWSYRDVTAQKNTELALRAAEARQRELATTDGLTGLWNRREVIVQLEREALRSVRSGSPLAVVLLDVDHFKRINDEHGHVVGDAVLRALADEVRQRLRRTDTIGRYGGEEFLALLPDTTRDAAHGLVEEVRSHLARPRDTLPRFTISAGIAEAPVDGLAPEGLLVSADRLLYAAKHAGRNRVCSRPPEAVARSSAG